LGILLSDDDESDDGKSSLVSSISLRKCFIRLDTVVVTSEGKTLDSKLIDKASDLWERATDKAEGKYDDRASSTPVAFTDFVPRDFQKRLSSSSTFSHDLIEPITDYFIKLEMTETSCLALSDLNLTGEIDRISWLLI
jgi:hypothetical protein